MTSTRAADLGAAIAAANDCEAKLITWDRSGARGLWRGPYDETLALAVRPVAQLRSRRRGDRERARQEGTRVAAHGAGRVLQGRRRSRPGRPTL